MALSYHGWLLSSIRRLEAEIIEFGKISDNNLVKLYSFEIKKTLSKGNYRESFFKLFCKLLLGE